MRKWKIVGKSLFDIGVFEGGTGDEALDAFARRAGYNDFENLCDAFGKIVERCKTKITIT